MNSHCVISVFT